MTSIMTAFLISCAAPAGAQVAVSTPPVTVDQAYHPASSRDPLVASTMYGDQKGTGKLRSKKDAGEQGVSKDTFTIYGLTLTGIMADARSRQALLKDAAGNLYTLKAGRLVDSEKRTVPGVSGVIKGKQVTLMTDDKKVHQLSLRERE